MNAADTLQGATVMARGILASRVLGFLRDMLLAHLLGPGADTFLVAFRIPNFLRRLLAEGSLGLVPATVCARIATREGRASALAFARHLWLTAFALSLPLTLLLMIAAPPLIALMAPGLVSRPEGIGRTALFLRICLLYLPFCALCAVGWATRLCMGDSRPQAYGTALFNVGILTAGLTAAMAEKASATQLPDAAMLLAFGVVMGGGLQLVCSGWPPEAFAAMPGNGARASGMSGPLRDGRVWATLGKVPGMVIGAAAHQLYVLAGTAMASFLAAGGISALYFAERLFELPLGLAGVAVGMAALPRLGELSHKETLGAFADTVSDGLRLSAFVSFPAAVGLGCLAGPLVGLLFGHGAYGQAELENTARCLAAYAPGLPAMCAARTLLSASATLDDGGRSALSAALRSLMFSIPAGACLMWFMGAPGIALGGAAGSWCNAWLLWRDLRRRGMDCPVRRIVRPLGAYTLAALAMGVCLLAFPFPDGMQDRMTVSLHLAVRIGGCLAAWYLGWRLASNRDIRLLTGIFFRGR